MGQGAENVQRTRRAAFTGWTMLGILNDEPAEFFERLLTGNQQLGWPRRRARGEPFLGAILHLSTSL